MSLPIDAVLQLGQERGSGFDLDWYQLINQCLRHPVAFFSLPFPVVMPQVSDKFEV